MRVITGTARGRRLKELQGMETRPTTDRVKEALFNIVQFELPGREVLDLFAGTGQLGIECLSRGAAEAVFAVISHSHNLVLIVEFDNYGNRSEDFLLRHTHIIGYAGNQSRLHEGTLSQLALCKALTAASNSSALLLSNFHIAQDFLDLGFVDLRTHLSIIIPGQAHLNLIEGFD